MQRRVVRQAQVVAEPVDDRSVGRCHLQGHGCSRTGHAVAAGPRLRGGRPALLSLHAGPAVAVLVLTQLAALAFDHALTPRERRRPAQLAAALSSPSFSFLPSSAAIETLEKCVEGVLESALFVAAVASAVAGRSYLRMKRAK